MTNIKNGTLVKLDDGTTATAFRDSDGTYRTSQRNLVTGGTRIDLGWRREQLTVVVE
jgi:hypothetical protein